MADPAPYQYLDATGVVVADTSSLLAETQSEYRTVFGADLVVTPDTPQGVLITAETLARTEVVKNNAALANQINPNVAGGVFLDAIMALTGMQRTPATKTVVPEVTLSGVAGTVISAGTQAKTAAGDLFVSLSTVTLSGAGSASVDFASVEYGPIPCGAGDLDAVVSSVLGWETVTNPTAGTPGAATQSDQAARALRQNTLAFQGVALAEAVTSALCATEGVRSLSFLENYNSAPQGMLVSIAGGSTLAGQIWGMTTTGVVVVGTDPMDFARSAQSLPIVNPWPVAAFSTTGEVTLSGLATQGGGDWPSTLTAGQVVLVKDQSTASENGLWLAASGAWTRDAYDADGSTILGSNSGISLIKNSIYACVDGGSDTDVAAALLENKSSGCAWNGGTTVNLVEPSSGQTYAVQFDRPNVVGVLVKVTTSNGNAANITQAILDYAAGKIDGLAGFVVGADVSPFEIAGAVMAESPGYYISKVEVSLTSPISYSTSAIAVGADEIAATQFSYITVVVA